MFLLIVFVLVSISQCKQKCTKLDPYCYCDDKCVAHGDCCPDHKDFTSTASLGDILTCEALNEFESVWMINKCRVQNHIYGDLCTKKKFLPNGKFQSLVAVIAEDDEFYQNRFCAMCNNQHKYVYSHAIVTCKGISMHNLTFQEVNSLINSGHNCEVIAQPQRVVRQCRTDFIRSCPQNYTLQSNVKRKCETGAYKKIESMRKSGLKKYRNNACCKCWNKKCEIWGKGSSNGFRKSDSFFLDFNSWTNSSATERGNETTMWWGQYMIPGISLGFLILAILALLVLIFIYTCHTVFHNIGGYLTVTLAVCLLIMDIMLIIVSKTEFLSNSPHCRIFGMIFHFFALSNFIWMAIYALDLMRTFVFQSPTERETKFLKTFIKYLFGGFGLASVVVGSAVVVDVTVDNNSTIRPAYGGRNCWFTSKIGGIIWYFVPVCVLLMWNMVSCILVSHALLKTSKDCKLARANQWRKTVGLCIRLTAIFGVCYMLQIIFVCSGVRALIEAGSLVNSLQGCLLAICFLWTKRVHGAVRLSLSSINKYQTVNATSGKLDHRIRKSIPEATSSTK